MNLYLSRGVFKVIHTRTIKYITDQILHLHYYKWKNNNTNNKKKLEKYSTIKLNIY